MKSFYDASLSNSEFLCNIVLHNPEIPQNTGNISRTCVATHSRLHLIHPLGFVITDTKIRRSGLDHWKQVSIKEHHDFSQFLENENPKRIFYFSKKGKQTLFECVFQRKDYLVFGCESNGLPNSIILDNQNNILSIPQTSEVRSLNISNAVAIVVYELLRQISVR